MRINTLGLVAAAAAALIAACADPAEGDGAGETDVVAITGVSIVDLTSESLSAPAVVLIRGGAIEEAGPDVEVPEGAEVFDHEGDYVLPGLWDMHVHFRGGEDLVDANAALLQQYVGFGVVGVRDAGGDIPDAVRKWRDAAEAGDAAKPRIYTSLGKIDGPTGGWPGSIRVTNTAEAAEAVATLDEAGADFVKLYDGSIAPANFLAAIDEAEARGLRTAGHMPVDAPFAEVLERGLDSMEHAYGLAKAAAPEDAAMSRDLADRKAAGDAPPFREAFPAFTTAGDEDHARRMFAEMAAGGLAMTPTLYISRLLAELDDVAPYESDPQFAAIPEGVRETYARRVEAALARTPEARAEQVAGMDYLRGLVALAHEEGVMFFAGSDSGATNSYVFPGDSLHRELAAMVDAGLSPAAALRAATVDAGRWMGREGRTGAVAPGYDADLLILEEDPLADIAATRKIAAVVRGGVRHDADAAAAMRKGGE